MILGVCHFIAALCSLGGRPNMIKWPTLMNAFRNFQKLTQPGARELVEGSEDSSVVLALVVPWEQC